MIIYEGRGNVFKCSAHTVTCPVNSVGTMGNGLAKAFRLNVPGLNEFYLKHYPRWHRNYEQHARQLYVFPVPDGRQVLLFPTKTNWREDSPIDLIDANLQTLAQRWEQWGIKSLALPALGCGQGGLSYVRDVRELIHAHLGPLSLPVQILL